MAEIVLGVGTIHAPFITGAPQMAPGERRQRVYDGFARLQRHIEQVEPDLIVAFSNEHITNFLPTQVPAHCISIAASNPVLPEFNLPDTSMPGDAEFARGFVEFCYDSAFDLSYAAELVLDHGTGLPLSMITPRFDIPVVVILQNVIYSPMPRVARSFTLGELVARYVVGLADERRVAVLGTGGISHWVGNARHGDVNRDFDEWFLRAIERGDHQVLTGLTQAEIDAAGDGANEIRNWVAVAGSTQHLSPKVILEETFIPGWNTSAYQVIWS